MTDLEFESLRAIPAARRYRLGFGYAIPCTVVEHNWTHPDLGVAGTGRTMQFKSKDDAFAFIQRRIDDRTMDPDREHLDEIEFDVLRNGMSLTSHLIPINQGWQKST